MNQFDNFASTSKVWIYQAERNLSKEEIGVADKAIEQFTQQWAAHSQALKAKGAILHQRFLVLMVDESMANASGCSIDSSVHFVQELGKHLSIDFFDRMNIAYPIEEVITDSSTITETINTFALKDFKQLFTEGKITDSLYIFNNTITNKKDFDEKWLIPIKDSWLARRIPKNSLN